MGLVEDASAELHDVICAHVDAVVVVNASPNSEMVAWLQHRGERYYPVDGTEGTTSAWWQFWNRRSRSEMSAGPCPPWAAVSTDACGQRKSSIPCLGEISCDTILWMKDFPRLSVQAGGPGTLT